MTAQEQSLNIASHASQLKKPKKRDAQAMVKWLYDECPGAREELASLYNFFMPAMSKKPKTDFEWVAKAVATNDVRRYLYFVHVSKEWIEASDGHRAHRVRNHRGLEPGFYNKVGDKVHAPDWDRFPEVGRIVPSRDSGGYERLTVNHLKVETTEAGLTVYRLPNGGQVQKQYLDQCMGADEATITAQDPSQAVRIDMGERVAVIMPVRQ